MKKNNQKISKLKSEIEEKRKKLKTLISRRNKLKAELDQAQSSRAFKLWKKYTFFKEKYILPVLIRFNLHKKLTKKNYQLNIINFNSTYNQWIRNNNLDLATIERQKKYSEKFKNKPLISIITPVYNTPEIYLHKMINSVINQSYGNWELCIINDSSSHLIIEPILKHYSKQDKRIKISHNKQNKGIVYSSNKAIDMTKGEYIGILDHDDELSPDALYEIVQSINENPAIEIIYSDDDKISENDLRYDPQFKPNWNPELFLSYCYLSHFKVIKKTLLDRVGKFKKEYEPSQDYDLFLRLTEKAEVIHHIPKILYHWRAIPGSVAYDANDKGNSIEAGRKAVEAALKRRKLDHVVTIPEFAQIRSLGIYRINFNLTYKPKISILIPTKDNLNMLKQCINSIEKKTNYTNYEIVVINNNSHKKETLNYLNQSKHKVISVKTDSFNYSYINNKAVEKVNSEYILFLNNDTEVINSNWLNEMAGVFTLDKKIGAVGAKLIYKDERVQHAGIIVGIHNTAGCANKLLYKDELGYLAYNQVLRDYSAVTAGCMLTKKSLFRSMGGFDEENLSISYNDVDYCLKLLEKGYRSVYNPYALLYHKENATRGKTKDEYKFEDYFYKKWKKFIKNDPFYNPNLTRANEKMEVATNKI